MDQLLKDGKVRRGMLGVTIQSVDSDLAASLNLPAARGAIVTSVAAGGPAERAGLQRGDVITAIDKQPIVDNNSLRNLVAAKGPGATVAVTAQRNGRDQQFQIALAELPDRPRPDAEESANGGPANTGNEKFGLTLQPLTPQMVTRFNLEAGDQGLLVMRVDPASNAANAGIRAGDLIQEVNRQPVRTFEQFNSALQQSGAKPALVLLKRRDQIIYVSLRPGS